MYEVELETLGVLKAITLIKGCIQARWIRLLAPPNSATIGSAAPGTYLTEHGGG